MTEVLNFGIYHFLTVAVVMFITGICGLIFAKNLLKLLISAQIMFLGIIINFVSFSAFSDSEVGKGGIFALFITVLVTLQIATGIAFIFNINKFKNNVNSDSIGELKG